MDYRPPLAISIACLVVGATILGISFGKLNHNFNPDKFEKQAVYMDVNGDGIKDKVYYGIEKKITEE